ncbi:MAG: hypothetical protein ACKVS9_09245 [Phycisphaerae bacterium]
MVEETDNAGTPRTLAQTVWGTEYIDEPVCRDRNTNVSINSDCLDSGGSQRYFYHQDANFRVCSLTSETGAIVERYEFDAYGEPRVFCGTAASAVSEGAAHTVLLSQADANLLVNVRFRSSPLNAPAPRES